ncbi:hypothetical protein [Phenylobacterium sp.]|uniref:hypothetical protein n=1 Tax=Phenylobacterium sp. TaxID=1871053 RepID=UPI003563E6E9
MRYRLSGAALGACVLMSASAHADNITIATKSVGSVVEHPLEVIEGVSGGAPTAVNMTNSGALDVTVVGGSSGASTKANASDPSLTEGSTTNQISVDLAGYARSLAKQAGTWNITNISGTISLPTLAATSTLQTTANTSLSTIATNTTSIATATNQTNLTGTKAPGTAAANSLLAGGVYTSGGITLTTGQQAALQFDSTGHLQVTGGGGGAVTGAASAFSDGWDVTQGAKADSAWTTGSGSVISLLKAIAGAAIDTTTPSPVKIDQTTVGTTNAVAVAQIGANTVLTGNGVTGAGSQRVTVASDNTPFAVKVDQTTPGTTNHVDAGLSAAATGGCTLTGIQSAASNNANFVKASAGTLCGGLAINTTPTLYYLRLYNLTAAPTCSSATGFVATIPVPASATGAGTLINLGPFGAAFTTGIAYCITGGGTSTDNTNAAVGVFITLATK